MDIPLNARQVMDIAGFMANMLPFGKVSEYKDIDELLVNDCCLINYLSTPKFGHWCCVTKNDDTITYFNPTGKFIDETIDNLPDFKHVSNQAFPHLLKLMHDSPYKCRYMDYPLQKPGTNSCGRYCGLFMRLHKLGDDEIIRTLKGFSNQEIINATNKLIDDMKWADKINFD